MFSCCLGSSHGGGMMVSPRNLPLTSSTGTTATTTMPSTTLAAHIPQSDIPIDHVVVLVLENRSFDSQLGWLYAPDRSSSSPNALIDCAGERVTNPATIASSYHGLLFDSSRAPSSSPPPSPSASPLVRNTKPIESPYYSCASSTSSAPTTEIKANLCADPIPEPALIATHTNNNNNNNNDSDDEERRHRWATEFVRQSYWPPLNPGEHHTHVTRQLYGVTFSDAADWSKAPTMRGFVDDYDAICADADDSEKRDTRGANIMQSVHPRLLPVTARLAREYAVCDCWHASVPTQTWANRLFLLSGTSHGIVYNDSTSQMQRAIAQLTEHPVRSLLTHMDVFHGGPEVNEYQEFDSERIPLFDVNRQASDGWSWAVYTHTPGYDMISSLLGQLFQREDIKATRYRDVSVLREDAAAAEPSRLPAFSLIEPAFLPVFRGGKLQLHNDNHPGEVHDELADKLERPPVWEADRLVLNVYEALFGSHVPRERRERTLLVVTYDEHGGCYDHRPPPTAANPHCAVDAKSTTTFAFQRLGVRVPALFISPRIARHTVLRPPAGYEAFDHTSISASVRKRWGVQVGGHVVDTPALTLRDATMPTFWGVLSKQCWDADGASGAGGAADRAYRQPDKIIEELRAELDMLDGRLRTAREVLQVPINEAPWKERLGKLWNMVTDAGKSILTAVLAWGAGPVKEAGFPFRPAGSKLLVAMGADGGGGPATIDGEDGKGGMAKKMATLDEEPQMAGMEEVQLDRKVLKAFNADGHASGSNGASAASQSARRPPVYVTEEMLFHQICGQDFCPLDDAHHAAETNGQVAKW